MFLAAPTTMTQSSDLEVQISFVAASETIQSTAITRSMNLSPVKIGTLLITVPLAKVFDFYLAVSLKKETATRT